MSNLEMQGWFVFQQMLDGNPDWLAPWTNWLQCDARKRATGEQMSPLF